MAQLSDLFSSTRKSKDISIEKAAKDLLIKKENLIAIEEGRWKDLPEQAFVKGFVKSYAQYLDLDVDHALALFRREYDERKYPQKPSFRKEKRSKFTPNFIVISTFIFAVIIFISYIVAQYLSILAAPRLQIFTPPDDTNTTVPVVQVSGKTDKGATVSIDGDFVALDQDGNFTYQLKLQNGRNVIEIIAAKRFSPKTKTTRIIRLTN